MWPSIEKIKLGSQEMETSRKRYRVPETTLIMARGDVGPVAYRPKPLISVELAVGMAPAEGAGVWYLDRVLVEEHH
jgi:hypothetical protein